MTRRTQKQDPETSGTEPMPGDGDNVVPFRDPLDGADDVTDPPAPPVEGDGDDEPLGPCPVKALGCAKGLYYFASPRGEIHELRATEVFHKAGISRIFGGDTSWLKRSFPVVDKKGNQVDAYDVADAGEFLMQECERRPLWDPNVPIRGRGVWPDGRGSDPEAKLIIHCGDRVFVHGRERSPGFRLGGILYPAFPAIPALDPEPATIEECAVLTRALSTGWNWVEDNAPLVAAGWIACSMLGAAKPWNPHLLLVAPPGAGKSMLATMFETVLPLAAMFDDFTQAGLRQSLTGEARPVLLDEAEGDENARGGPGAVELAVQLIRRLSGERGLRSVRGSSGGLAQRFNATGSAALFAVLPPDLMPQDLTRITRLDLKQLPTDADPEAVRELLRELAELSVPIWSRVIRMRAIYLENLRVIRHVLGAHGCNPRQQDQPGSILAGLALLEHDKAIEPKEAERLIDWCRFIVQRGEQAELDTGPRRCIERLLTSQPEGYRDGYRRTIGQIYAMCRIGDNDLRAILGATGLRVEFDAKGYPCGLYVANQFVGLQRIFTGSAWAGGRWADDLARLPGATKAGPTRIGGGQSRAVLVPPLYLPEPEDRKPHDAPAAPGPSASPAPP